MMYATVAPRRTFLGRTIPGADRNQALTYGTFLAMMRFAGLPGAR